MNPPWQYHSIQIWTWNTFVAVLWIRIRKVPGSVSGFTWNAASVSGFSESGSTTLLPLISWSVADPVSGAFVTPGSGMGRKSASGSGIRYEQKSDPGSVIRDKHPGSATLISCCSVSFIFYFLFVRLCAECPGRFSEHHEERISDAGQRTEG
jgi:hypothetical protein